VPKVLGGGVLFQGKKKKIFSFGGKKLCQLFSSFFTWSKLP